MKLLIMLAGLVAAVAVGGTVAYALDGGSSGGSTTPTSQVDVSGPCDEAEHANDPRCTGAQAGDDVEDETADGREDVSGPCDEDEHANDPRCTGGTVTDDDRSGPSDDSGHGGSDDDPDDDDNSGPGGGSDDDD